MEVGGSFEDEAPRGGGGGAHFGRGSVVPLLLRVLPAVQTSTRLHARRYAFPIFSFTAYHVIVETYAGEQANMCTGPGVHREAEGYTVHCRLTNNSLVPLSLLIFFLLPLCFCHGTLVPPLNWPPLFTVVHILICPFICSVDIYLCSY